MRALGLRRVVLLTPYLQAANDHEKEFLAEFGIEVVHDVALACPSANDYLTISVARLVELARDLARVPSDGFFLSCTNSTQIEAIDAIEQETGKPVVNSNQATLWAALKRIGGGVGVPRLPGLGRLFARPVPAMA